jgi:ketosteroid isomerase-like protein
VRRRRRPERHHRSGAGRRSARTRPRFRGRRCREYRGYDGVRRFWTQFLSGWDEYGVEVEELIDAGDQVVAVMRLSGRTNELEVDEARSSLLTLRDGRIVRIEPFASKDGALEAAGLSE